MGGAAGHMSHPFDLGWVNTGSDLLDFFERAKTFVEKKGAGAVKIDGVNVSFKLVEHNGIKQFAVDRGSLKPIDIEGITMDRVDERFPEGHGMRPAIKTLLTILNKSLAAVQPELEEMGMWEDPSRFLNTEYVAGTTNVTKYDENFLAIHGLSQFYHKIGKSGASKGRERPGMERPEGVKAPSVEIPIDSSTMDKLVKKLNPVANEYGFQVYGSVPTEKMADIDYSATLSTLITIVVSEDREITRSLGDWLKEAQNPRYKVIKLQDGSKTHPLHKQLYQNIINGTPVVDLLDQGDAQDAIYGAIFMHATRLLGNDVLNSLTSPMGDVMNHEGIVMRDEKLFGPNPVKITGEFIVGNLSGGFGDIKEEEGDESVELDIIDNEDADPVGSMAGGQKIAIVPGAFKPPHRGHLEMVENYAERADEVVVLISAPLKSGRKLPNDREITAADLSKIWDVMASHLPNVRVEASPHASPITATYDFISEKGDLKAGTEVILGVCTKGGDVERFRQAEHYVKDGVRLLPIDECAVEPGVHSSYYMDLLSQSPLQQEMPSVKSSKDPKQFHASDMRYLLGKAEEDEEAIELLEDFTGEDNVFDILSILGLGTGLQEMSAGGGGAVAGYAMPVGKRDTKKKKKLKPYQETMDFSVVEEVLTLIMERGVLR